MTSAVARGRSDDPVLLDPVWASLTGPHEGFARVLGDARRYDGEVSVLAAVTPGAGAAAWADLRTLQRPGERTVLFGPRPWTGHPPPGWQVGREFDGWQLVAPDGVDGAPDPEAVVLGDVDGPDLQDLVARTEPGPFGPRTPSMGRFVGLRDRHDGRLVAMAGERLRPGGYVEISAVCTDPSARGRGLAARVVGDVVAAARARGEQPMLHVAAGNTAALRLYERLGFVRSRRMFFTLLV